MVQKSPKHLENTGDNLYHINMVSLPDFSHPTVGLVMYESRQLKVSCWGLDRNQNKTQYNTPFGGHYGFIVIYPYNRVCLIITWNNPEKNLEETQTITKGQQYLSIFMGPNFPM